MDLYKSMDAAVSSELNTSLENYIDKIEKTTHNRRMVIIGAALSEDLILIKKAIKIFNLIE